MAFGNSPILIDGVSFIAASTGTGDFVFSLARPSFYTPAQSVTAGQLADGQRVAYLAQDDPYAPTQREWGHGTYVNSTATVQRTTVIGGISAGVSSGTSKVNFTKQPVVSLTALAEDIVSYDINNHVTIGSTPNLNVGGTASVLQTVQNNDANLDLAVVNYNNAGNGANWSIYSTRGSTPTTHVAATGGDFIHTINWLGDNGTTQVTAAAMSALVDVTATSSQMPGRLIFYTGTTGSNTLKEVFRLDSNQAIITGGTSFQNTVSHAGQIQTNCNVAGSYLSVNGWGFKSIIQTFMSNSTTIGTQSAIPANTSICNLLFNGSDGTQSLTGAYIVAQSSIGTAFTTNSAPTALRFGTSNVSASFPSDVFIMDQAGNCYSQGTLGYGNAFAAAAVGGTVTQATSKSTGVTLNTICGQITMNNAALATKTAVSFTVTNSTVAATDTIIVCVASGTTGNYLVSIQAVAAGSFQIALFNATAGSLSDAVVLNYAVIKSVTS